MIIRIVKDNENPYVMINKELLNNKDLSWKAKGLLVYLLSLPDDWKFYLNDLKNRSSDGISATASTLKELEKFGYLVRKRIYNKGRICGIDYTIYEKPILKSENLNQVIMNKENQPLLINNLTNNELTNNPSPPKKKKIGGDDIQSKNNDTELHNKIKQWFKDNYPGYSHNAKRAGIIKKLEGKCNGRGFDDFKDVADKFIKLKNCGDSWWENMPTIPETIISKWDYIISAKFKVKPKVERVEDYY